MTASVTLSASRAGESARQLAVAAPPPMPGRHSLERRSADAAPGKLQASGRRPLVRSTSEVSACPVPMQEPCDRSHADCGLPRTCVIHCLWCGRS